MPHHSAYRPGGSEFGFSTATCRAVEMKDAGLVWGDGSILVRMSKASQGPPRLCLDADRDRFATLMLVVGDRPVASDALEHIEAADRFWQRGDKALANLRLIFADLPRLATLTDLYRLTLATHLLDQGMAPDALAKELGLKLATEALKYAPDQARIPAGHGVQSGQFTFGHESAGATRRIVLAMDDDGANDREGVQHFGESIPTPPKDPNHLRHPPFLPGPPPFPVLPPGIGPGNSAGRSIPAGPGGRPSPAQQKEINEIGCHTCGTKDPGTDRGNFVGDHQPFKKLNPPGAQQRYFPQCQTCSNVQGGKVRHFKPPDVE